MDEVEAIEAIVVVVEFISRRRFSPPFGMAPHQGNGDKGFRASSNVPNYHDYMSSGKISY